MKLRIRGDSIRLRLTRGEVESVVAGADVEEQTHFGPSVLTYRLRGSNDLDQPEARFDDGCVTVLLPTRTVRSWGASDELSIEAQQGAGDRSLRILVEKDLQCLTPRADEDDSDAYPNPGCAV